MTTTARDNPAPAAAPSPGFAGAYASLPGAADELIDSGGALRPHWRAFVNAVDDLGPSEMARRWEAARRLIHENGVTHNVYGDPDGLDRPWSLDSVPLLVTAHEWRAVAAGLDQRARLLDLLLADLYGPAKSVAERLLPPELVYANPGFLRPCHGFRPPRGRRLHLYGADLVRGAGGGFIVLSDRTQAPSGAGYSLENRIVLSRALPGVFKQCNVQRLAPFFVALRNTLTGLAPANRENPRVVLLTPGPYNETYFEHAYLARYLGYTLVQGNDLTVRDAKVYLKTLGGLQRVDVILRRVDDDFCDPLELLPQSYLGVPGLLQSAREGNVAVANALGSGVLQGPAFLPYLPALCRQFLGEDLLIPSVRTWWCGEASSLKHVLANLDRLVVKPSFPERGHDPVFGDDLSTADRARLAADIARRPAQYVAQERVMTSTAPALTDGVARPRRFVLRAYLAAVGDSGYAAMPGGLARITNASDSFVVSLQQGGGSKDTWVLADGPVADVSLLAPPSRPVDLSRGGGDLPSRVADDLFWLGRYVQRADAIARITRSAFNRLAEQSGPHAPRAVDLLAREILGRRPAPGGQVERELLTHVFGRNRRYGLRSAVEGVHELARTLRDRISIDAWRILQNIERDVDSFDPDPADPVAGVLEMLNKVVVDVAAFGGLALDSMTRGQAWRFLDMGHRLERATGVARLLRTTLVDAPADPGPLLDALLDVADSSLTYRRRYLTQLQAHAVVDLLLADEANPRAVAFQVAAIAEHLDRLPREGTHPRQHPERQLAQKLRTALQLADLPAACAVVEGARPGLDGLLADTLNALASISDRVAQVYFTHAGVQRHLGDGAAPPGIAAGLPPAPAEDPS